MRRRETRRRREGDARWATFRRRTKRRLAIDGAKAIRRVRDGQRRTAPSPREGDRSIENDRARGWTVVAVRRRSRRRDVSSVVVVARRASSCVARRPFPPINRTDFSKMMWYGSVPASKFAANVRCSRFRVAAAAAWKSRRSRRPAAERARASGIHGCGGSAGREGACARQTTKGDQGSSRPRPRRQRRHDDTNISRPPRGVLAPAARPTTAPQSHPLAPSPASVVEREGGGA